jgi:integrase
VSERTIVPVDRGSNVIGVDFGPNVILVDGVDEPEKPKGVHSVKKALADSRIAIYDYAWKGGPRLIGPRGSPGYLASQKEAFDRRKETHVDFTTIRGLIVKYKLSTAYTDLAASTLVNRPMYLAEIEREFGDMPLSALTVRGTRGLFQAWREEIVNGTKPPLNPRTPGKYRVRLPDGTEQRRGSRAQADRHWEALCRMLNWALDRELIDANPAERGGYLYHGSRREFIWTVEREARFFQGVPEQDRAPAPYYHQDAYYLGVWTGQREYDLINLCWSAYDGTYIQLQQHKRPNPYTEGKRIRLRVAEPLKRRLDIMAIRQGIDKLSEEERAERHILLSSLGQRWLNGKSFSQSFHVAAREAGVPDRTYHDLRGTAVVRFAKAGSRVLQIMAITGHSLGDVKTIFETHYLLLDEELGDQAIAQREMSAVFPTDLAPNGTVDIALARNLSNPLLGLPTAFPTTPQLAPYRSPSVPEEREMFRLLLNEVRDLKKQLGSFA